MNHVSCTVLRKSVDDKIKRRVRGETSGKHALESSCRAISTELCTHCGEEMSLAELSLIIRHARQLSVDEGFPNRHRGELSLPKADRAFDTRDGPDPSISTFKRYQRSNKQRVARSIASVPAQLSPGACLEYSSLLRTAFLTGNRPEQRLDTTAAAPRLGLEAYDGLSFSQSGRPCERCKTSSTTVFTFS
jgi:hypothetical protein